MLDKATSHSLPGKEIVLRSLALNLPGVLSLDSVISVTRKREIKRVLVTLHDS